MWLAGGVAVVVSAVDVDFVAAVSAAAAVGVAVVAGT